MKEYKLSRTSKYSVLYLLSGLFMFFFIFAILNLSSYASSFPVSSQGSFEFKSGFVSITNNSSWKTYYNPYTNVHGAVSVSTSNSSLSNVIIQVHFVTSVGDFVVSSDFPVGSSSSYDKDLEGYPIGYYVVVTGSYSGTTSTSIPYSYTCNYSCTDVVNGFVSDSRRLLSNTNEILSLLGGGDSPLTDVFSDYSSYSPLTLMNNVSFRTDYSDEVVPAGSPCLFSFKDLNSSSLNFSPRYLTFNIPSGHSKILVVFIVDNKSSSVSNDLNFNVLYNGVSTNYGASDFNIIRSYTDGTNSRWVCSKVFEFDSDVDMNLVYMVLQGNSPSTISSFNFMGYIYKATIADYMQYVKDNYDNINPSVTDLNQNTAQSVSDIGTAQTFESSAFTNFDNQLTSSGLDTFSLSFASQPLLWCAGLINTFYNNMPSVFQYLLMFVAFIGVLVIIFNISGRVIRRFGGGD